MPMHPQLDVIAWDTVDLPAALDQHWTLAFRHQQTVGFDGDLPPPSCIGVALWEARIDGRRVGIAWRWIARSRGVIALADPMQIVSNARFLMADGEPMGAGMSIVQLNNIVHALPWQEHARIQTRSLRSAARVPSPLAVADRRGC